MLEMIKKALFGTATAGACVAPEPCSRCRNHRRKWINCVGNCVTVRSC